MVFILIAMTNDQRMCRWTPKGSIDGSILLDIVKTLDVLNVFRTERENALKPILRVDAHGSRLSESVDSADIDIYSECV